ncbi:MAG: hypothetical protein WDO24_00510 [Pseudomonadota bacterium]
MQLRNKSITTWVVVLAALNAAALSLIALYSVLTLNGLQETLARISAASQYALLTSRMNSSVVSLDLEQFRVAAEPTPAAIELATRNMQRSRKLVEDRVREAAALDYPDPSHAMDGFTQVFATYADGIVALFQRAEDLTKAGSGDAVRRRRGRAGT